MLARGSQKKIIVCMLIVNASKLLDMGVMFWQCSLLFTVLFFMNVFVF